MVVSQGLAQKPKSWTLSLAFGIWPMDPRISWLRSGPWSVVHGSLALPVPPTAASLSVSHHRNALNDLGQAGPASVSPSSQLLAPVPLMASGMTFLHQQKLFILEAGDGFSPVYLYTRCPTERWR